MESIRTIREEDMQRLHKLFKNVVKKLNNQLLTLG